MAMKDWLQDDKPQSLLGLDISTNSVAYCLNTKNGIETWGEITFIGPTVFDRIADAQKRLATELPDMTYDMILFESAVYIQNKKTVVQLAYAYGAVIAPLMRPHVRVEEITPLVWQPAIGNKPFTAQEKTELRQQYPAKSKAWYLTKQRQIRKQRTMDWVIEQYGLNVGTDNQADAIAISKVGVDLYC